MMRNGPLDDAPHAVQTTMRWKIIANSPNFLQGDSYDIDTSLDTIYANATRSRTILVHGPNDCFQMLSLEGHRQWSSLSDDDRKILLSSGATTTSSLMMDDTTGLRGGFLDKAEAG